MKQDTSENTPGFDTNRGIGRLYFALHSALKEAENTLIVAPTSLGKTHKVATTKWRDKQILTEGQPVIHVSQTKNARDYAAELSRKEPGVNANVLKGREDTCPVASGEYDDDLIVPDERSTPSKWFNRMCDVGGVPFSEAHDRLSQLLGGLPCSKGTKCEGVTQWTEWFMGNATRYDVLHVTQSFLFNSELVDGANVIFDEQPSYTTQVKKEIRHAAQIGRATTREHIREAVNECFSELYGVDHTWEELVVAVNSNDQETLVAIENGLTAPPDAMSWALTADNAHALAPAIIKALLNTEEVGNGRRRGTSRFTPSEVGLEARGTTDVTVVLDTKNRLKLIHHPPNLSNARCVIGLDAHPTELLWRLNTVPNLRIESLLDGDENKRWRTHERGLHVHQVGGATRSYTRGWAGDTPTQRDRTKRRAKALIGAIREKYGEEFRTCITAKSIRGDVGQMLMEAGVPNPEVLHYGGLKSLDNFGQETVGLLIGCIDPGDHNILDTLALLGLEAEAVQTENSDGEIVREPGRGFVGPDAGAAREILEAVRERNVAQAIGRYARDSSDDSTATVYVWTDAIPKGMVDKTVPGVVDLLINKQRWIVDLVQQAETPMTAQEVTDELEARDRTVSKEHVRKTMKELVERGAANVCGGGYNGAYKYSIDQGTTTDLVDLNPLSPTNPLS